MFLLTGIEAPVIFFPFCFVLRLPGPTRESIRLAHSINILKSQRGEEGEEGWKKKMVLFYANVSVEQKAKARGLGHLLGLIIGREEGEVPDIAGAKVSPTFFIRHVSERRGIFFIFLFYFFSENVTAAAICTPPLLRNLLD